MVERRKVEAIIAKYHGNKRGISLYNEEEKNYSSDIVDDIDPNQTEGKFPGLRLDGSETIND